MPTVQNMPFPKGFDPVKWQESHDAYNVSVHNTSPDRGTREPVEIPLVEPPTE